MKISWGAKLVFAAACFMGFVLFLVFRIVSTDMPLVEKGYYEKGMSYQEQIDQNAGSDSLIEMSVGMVCQAGQAAFQALELKQHTGAIILRGTASFYRASDQTKDITLPFELHDTTPSMIPLTEFAKGKWKVTLNWARGEDKHALTKDIFLE